MDTAKTKLRIEELINQLNAIPWDAGGWSQQLPLAKEAIQLTDELGDEVKGFHLRLRLANITTNLRLAEQALVAISWCFATLDRVSDRLPSSAVQHAVISARNILDELPSIPSIPRTDIDQLFNEIVRLYRGIGLSRHSTYEVHQRVLMEVGDLERAADAFARWRTQPHDESCMYDCDTCEAAGVTKWLLAIGNDEDALAAAQPALGERASAANVWCIEHRQ